jgi:hypothetical protein
VFLLFYQKSVELIGKRVIRFHDCLWDFSLSWRSIRICDIAYWN